MRLTLRTLLAYMDDILEPQQAKEIGEKIAQSDFAATLSHRIKDVLRRRRITAPDIAGPGSGIDPNTVAEYLDNTMSPQAVAEIERIFMESDVHLAEVAASHQILTLVLGEPVDVPPESRERMYALGPDAAAEDTPAETKAKDASNGSRKIRLGRKASAATVPAETQPAASFSESLPPQLRRKPFWKRLFPYAVVVVLAGAFIGVVMTDPSLFSGFVTDDEPETKKPGAGQLADADGKKTSAPKTVQPSPEKKTSVKKDSQLVAKNSPKGKTFPLPNVPKGLNPPPPPDKKEPANGTKQPAGKKPGIVDPNPPVVIAKVPKGAPQPKQNPPAKKGAVQPPKPKAKPVAGPAPPMQYQLPTGKGMLLRYDGKRKDWLIMAPRSVVHPGDTLASPAPFDSFLEIGEGRCRAVLQGGTAAGILGPHAVAPFGFDVRRGRIVLKTPPLSEPPEKKQPGLAVGLKIRGELYRLELLTPGTVCGIDIQPVIPHEFEQDFGRDVVTGGIYVGVGSVQLSRGGETIAVIDAADTAKGMVGKAGWISLKPSDREMKSDKTKAVVEAVAVPDWLTAEVRPRSVSVERFSTLYLKEFERDGTTSDGQVRISMRDNLTAIVRDRRALVSEFAVRALSVTETYPELVRALAIAPHEESRRAAIEGLRAWLPGDPENGKRLRKELRLVFTEEEADIIYRLLWGYDKNDLQDEATSRQLVEWMNHNHIAVRELAFLHVFRLTGRRDGYRPNLVPSQRVLAVNRWQMYVNKHKALLPTSNE